MTSEKKKIEFRASEKAPIAVKLPRVEPGRGRLDIYKGEVLESVSRINDKGG